MREKITKDRVDRLRPKENGRAEFLWCRELKGFGVKCLPSMQKVFIVQYRHANKSWRYRLGRHGPLTVDEARQRAKRILGLVAAGDNPARQRRSNRDREAAVLTVRELAALFIEQHVEKLKPMSRENYTQVLRQYVIRALGDRRADEVERADIKRLHDQVTRDGKPVQANRAVALTSGLFTWGAANDYVPGLANPTKGIKKNPEKARERFLKPEEYQRMGAALDATEAEGSVTPFTAAAIRLLALTGCRKNEIMTLRWGHVNFDNECLRLPDSKTGAKVVVLPPAAVAVLRSLPRVDGEGERVIVASTRHGGTPNLQRAWGRVRKRAGLDDVPLHSLRHSHASTGIGIGLSLPLVGGLLGHRRMSTTERYAHLANDPLRRASALVGAEVASLLGLPAAKVVDFQDERERRAVH